MKIKKAKWIIALGVLALAVSACGNSNATLTPPPTRLATQTPWIIYVPITTTPEPTILPLLPTAEPKTTAVPTRAPTRVVVKPTIAPTKPPVAVASIAKPTETPCNLGSITPREPNDGALRRTKEVGVGGDTFRFIWDPPPNLQGEGDPTVGYKLEIVSKRNSTAVYISQNKFWRDGKLYILDKPAVSTLASGESVNVTWWVTIIKATGSYNEADPAVPPSGITICGPRSPVWTIKLDTFE